MADSISNSWAAESDIPSGENVSHISRDYTPEFTTNQASICYFFIILLLKVDPIALYCCIFIIY